MYTSYINWDPFPLLQPGFITYIPAIEYHIVIKRMREIYVSWNDVYDIV